MTKKKAKVDKAAEKKPAKRKKGTKKQVDPAQVREQLAGIVKSGAKGITKKMMDQAMHGELAPAKYLLEMAGVYPPTSEDEQTIQEEDCLAKTLLDRLNVPHKPTANGQADEKDDGAQDNDRQAEDEVEKTDQSSQDSDNETTKEENESPSIPE
jgi:hypothetical protein